MTISDTVYHMPPLLVFGGSASTLCLIWHYTKSRPDSKDLSIAIELSHINICLVMAFRGLGFVCFLLLCFNGLSWPNSQALILVPLRYARVEMLNLCFNLLNTRVLNCTLLVRYVFLLPTQLYSRNKAIQFHNSFLPALTAPPQDKDDFFFH